MEYQIYQVSSGGKNYNVIVALREETPTANVVGGAPLTAEQVALDLVTSLAGSGGAVVTPLVGLAYANVPGLAPAQATAIYYGFGSQQPPGPPPPSGNYAVIALGPQDRLLGAAWPA